MLIESHCAIMVYVAYSVHAKTSCEPAQIDSYRVDIL